MPGKTAKSLMFWLAVVVASVVVYVYANAQVAGPPQAQPKVSDFKITLQLTNHRIVAQCVKGCAWKELSYGCDDSNLPCKAEIDQLGVAAAK